MLDTLSVTLPLDHPEREEINDGAVSAHDRAGSLDWSSPRRRPFEGTFDARTFVRSEGNGVATMGTVTLMGSAAKFLQGHNVFGTDDLVGLVTEWASRICHAAGVFPTSENLDSWHSGDFTVHRADVTHSLHLGSPFNVREMLRAIEHTAVMRFRGRANAEPGSLLYGKGSEYWSLLLYDKLRELSSRKKGHALPLNLPQRDDVLAYAAGLLRVELRLLSKAVKRLELSSGAAWLGTDLPPAIHAKHLGRLEMPEFIELPDETVQALPQHLRVTYALHRKGVDTFALMKPRTWHRHRAALRKHGIDIATNIGCEPDRSNVIPFVRRIEAVLDYGNQVPDWARETELYFDPSKKTSTSG